MKIFDLHCDTLCSLHGNWTEGAPAQLDIAALPEDRCGCQTFAVFLDDGVPARQSSDYFRALLDFAGGYFAQQSSRLSPAKSAAEISAAAEGGRIAALLSVENAGALGAQYFDAELFSQAGIRLAGLTWNGANELAGGVNSDAGLTGAGRAAIAELERRGIVLDVSHMNDRSFWQAAEAAQRPFIASHSNSRTVCAHARNLTDEQFSLIAERGGLVGLNMYPPFLRGEKAKFDDLLRHIDHLLSLGGEKALALGSDFDGAAMPDFVKDAAALDFVYQSMIKSSLGKDLTDDIFYNNAYAFFKRMEENF